MSAIQKIIPLGFVWETADPFLFCVHHDDRFPPGNEEMGPDVSLKGRNLGNDFEPKDGFRMYHGEVVPGFPGHPHRGFETVTVVRKGLVDHADSTGSAGRYGDGDVQWLTAGKGVLHSEMFPLLKQDGGNPMELFQIWLNLPAKSKMAEPHFKMLWRDMIPVKKFISENGSATQVEVIAGTLGDATPQSPPPDSWAADPQNDVAIWNIRMEPGASWTMPAASAGINRRLYVYEGDTCLIAGTSVSRDKAAVVDPTAELRLEAGSGPVAVLVLQGKPIGEPVAQYGPFVMNTEAEIQQAFADYRRTQFGGWPWPLYDQVHPREKPRFAKYADGSEEVKA